ncbi:unnamed protein product [Eruca vesicaria subsp. sativa]|uniref:Uncharacterized protein n=1 Tax=Eruca vesicaria subsp. sativa TaxID=29727 RepID=A0ABC8JVY9_ERUVS|nr:unnamed protein product [Eruca vesicaria subsp. sativa]
MSFLDLILLENKLNDSLHSVKDRADVFGSGRGEGGGGAKLGFVMSLGWRCRDNGVRERDRVLVNHMTEKEYKLKTTGDVWHSSLGSLTLTNVVKI